MRTDWLTTLDPMIMIANEDVLITQTWRDMFGSGPPVLDANPVDDEWDEVRVVSDGSVYRRDGHRVLHRRGAEATILLVTDTGAVAPESEVFPLGSIPGDPGFDNGGDCESSR